MAGIPPRAWLALAAYVALLTTLATPLYEPFESGEDDSWVTVVVLAGAHLGVGIAVARAWVLLLPVAASVIGFFVTGGEALSWLILIFELPIGLVLTALGCAAGHFAGRWASVAAAPVFVVAAMPTAAAAVEAIERSNSPHVPAAVQRQLPIDESLSSDCGHKARAEAPARVLLRELDRNPDALVTYTYYFADTPDAEHRDITVRELAEEQLRDLRANPGCRDDVRRRLERALGA